MACSWLVFLVFCISRCVPFFRRQAQDARHHGRYGPEGQLRGESLGHGARGSDCGKCGFSAVAVHQGRRHLLRVSEAHPHGSCDHRDSPVARGQGGRAPYAGRADFPVLVQRQIPMVLIVCRTKEFPQLLDTVIDVLVAQVVHFFSGWCLSSVHG